MTPDCLSFVCAEMDEWPLNDGLCLLLVYTIIPYYTVPYFWTVLYPKFIFFRSNILKWYAPAILYRNEQLQKLPWFTWKKADQQHHRSKKNGDPAQVITLQRGHRVSPVAAVATCEFDVISAPASATRTWSLEATAKRQNREPMIDRFLMVTKDSLERAHGVATIVCL